MSGTPGETTKILRFPKLKNHIEEFIAFDLGEVIDEISFYCGYGAIGIFYVPMLSKDFIEGVDFYILINEKTIPIHVTDNVKNLQIFSEKGIRAVLLPERNKNGELFFPLEKRSIVRCQLKKIIKSTPYV